MSARRVRSAPRRADTVDGGGATVTDLRTLLRGGGTVPAFRMLLPQGWTAHRPDEQGQRQLLDEAAKKLAVAGRPELLVQLRAQAATAYRHLREQRAFLVIMPGEGTPQSLFLPATITGIERVGTPEASEAEVVVDATSARMLVDTGASMIALTAEDADAIGVPWRSEQTEPVARGAGGIVHGVRIVLDLVQVGGLEARDVEAVVVPEGLAISLLGQSFLSQVARVEIDRQKMVLGG